MVNGGLKEVLIKGAVTGALIGLVADKLVGVVLGVVKVQQLGKKKTAY